MLMLKALIGKRRELLALLKIRVLAEAAGHSQLLPT
jgi:hypothetical protein